MKTQIPALEMNGYILYLAQKNEAEEYYQHNFNPLDKEVAYLTGCKTEFDHDEVVEFFKKCVEAEDRYDFLIISHDGRIVGESIIEVPIIELEYFIMMNVEKVQGLGL